MNLTNTENLLQHNLELHFGCYLKLWIDPIGKGNLSYEEEESSTDYDVIKQVLAANGKNDKNYVVVIFAIHAVLNIVANFLLIFGLLRTNKKIFRVQKLFIYLSFTDLIAGCVVMPVFIFYHFRGLTCLHMALTIGITVYVALADACILLIISILRLMSIRKPMSSQEHDKPTIFMIIAQILFSFLFGFAMFWFFYEADELREFQVIAYSVNTAQTGISLGIVVCVSMSLYTLRKYERTNSNILTADQLKNHRKSVSSLLLIGIMMAVFVSIQAPMSLVLHSKTEGAEDLKFGAESFRSSIQAVDMVVLISQLNTVTNAIVIIGRSKKLRNYLFRVC